MGQQGDRACQQGQRQYGANGGEEIEREGNGVTGQPAQGIGEQPIKRLGQIGLPGPARQFGYLQKVAE